MLNLKWDQKYSVGHSRIDHEHQVFLNLIKNVSLADDTHKSREDILRLLIEVKKYADFHFYSEENIMLDHQYPDYDEHKKEHERLLAKLDDQFHSYKVGAIELHSVVEFLFNWFALHTTGTDKRLVNYISENF